MGSNKIKSCCTTKETISKVKRQPLEWEKIIANKATDKELISKIYKQHLQLNSRKINDPIKIWAKEQTHEKMLNITHYQRNANQNYNEVTILCQSEWLLSKSLQAINAGEGVEKREPSYTVGGNAN